MKFKKIYITFFNSIFLLFFTDTFAQTIVIVKGFGANENTALNDAKKVAIGKICGETIIGSTRLLSETEKNTKIDSSGGSSQSLNINSKSADDNLSLYGGSIKSFKQLNKGEENGGVYVELEAIVTDCKSSDAVQSGLVAPALVETLKNISAELRTLGSRGGLVEEPKTYAEIYHNARLLAQRGELDRAFQAYDKLFGYPLQMADPVIDTVTLARRLYGLQGARRFVEQKLKNRMAKPSHLYTQLLLTDPGRESEIELEKIASNRDWLGAAQQFPPLAYQILVMKKPYRASQQIHKFTWTERLFYFELHKILERSIESGEFIAYFVDQLRGGNQVDSYGREEMNSTFKWFFLYLLPNSDMPSPNILHTVPGGIRFNEKLISDFRVVDIEKSPIIIDYTYHFESPLLYFGSSYFSWKFKPNAPEWESGLVRLSAWDSFIDKGQPFNVCATTKRGGETCLNLNAPEFNCNKLPGMNRNSERYKCFTVIGNLSDTGMWHFPNADSTFSPQEWLKSACITRVSYVDGRGTQINVPAGNMVATYRWPVGRKGNTVIDSAIQRCGYQNQSSRVGPKGVTPFN